MADTKFVRLAIHLARGGRYDLNSGWGISGLDVKEMPDPDDEPNAYKYVRGELAAGRLEGASRAEYDEAHPDIAKDLGYRTGTEADPSARPYQEREVQRAAAKVLRKVKARREAQSEVDAFEVDTARREATIKAQQAQEGRVKGKQAKSAAEAEDEAAAATQVHLNREADARRTGANPTIPVDDDDDDEGDDYDAMSKPDLIEEAKRRELPHGGSAEKIRDRLRAHDAEGDDGDDSDDDGDDDGTEDDGTEDTSNQS